MKEETQVHALTMYEDRTGKWVICVTCTKRIPITGNRNVCPVDGTVVDDKGWVIEPIEVEESEPQTCSESGCMKPAIEVRQLLNPDGDTTPWPLCADHRAKYDNAANTVAPDPNSES